MVGRKFLDAREAWIAVQPRLTMHAIVLGRAAAARWLGHKTHHESFLSHGEASAFKADSITALGICRAITRRRIAP